MLLDFEAQRTMLAKYAITTLMKETGLSRYILETFIKGDYDKVKLCYLRTILSFIDKEHKKLNTEE